MKPQTAVCDAYPSRDAAAFGREPPGMGCDVIGRANAGNGCLKGDVGVQLGDNTVLITGGSMGIGLGLAEAFLNAGSEVIVCGRREARLQEARERLPGLHIRVCDVADREEQKRLYEWAVERFPKLNVLINNAGIQRHIELTQGVDEILAGESEIAVNLEAPILLAARFIPHLARQPRAAIVNVSSGLVFRPLARMPLY